MIKCSDKNIVKAFDYILDYLNIKKCPDISCVYDKAQTCFVSKNKKKYTFYYSEKSYLFKSFLTFLCSNSNSDFSVKRSFNRFGIMLDCARNGVPSVSGLKRFIVNMSLLGYNYLGLYFEDCLEIENEPFFGYMRGRYTKDEIKEIVEFSDLFGIEIVPYIQTLAHISRIFNHYDVYTAKIRDTNDILLIDEPRTYELIANEIKTISKIFKSKYVNIGMDEAFLVGLGKYRELHGICDRSELLLRHTEKICEICGKYGLTPIAYSDTFVRLFNEKNKIPKNLVLNVWNYSFNNNDKDNPLNKISNKKTFSSGVHKWYGYAPLNEFSERIYLGAINNTKGVFDDFSIALWGDDGAECSYNSVWYSLIKASNEVYNELNDIILSKVSLLLTKYTMEELLALDLPNKVFDCKMLKPINISKYLLFEDLFMGIADKSDSKAYTPYFTRNKEILLKLSKRNSFYSYIFYEEYFLCCILEQKNDLRIDIINAYKSKSFNGLNEISDKIDLLLKQISKFIKSVYIAWEKDNKPFGIEIQTIRLFGLIGRLKYVKNKIKKYVNGDIEKIEELEEINISPLPKDDEYNGAGLFNNYEMNVTYGNLTHRVYN